MGFLTDNLYLIPDFFYVVGLLSYAKIRFQRNDYRILIVDAFFLAAVTFVASQGVFHYLNPDYKMTFENLNSILYFFVTVFTLLVVFLPLYGLYELSVLVVPGSRNGAGGSSQDDGGA
jgi:hypothetical protein